MLDEIRALVVHRPRDVLSLIGIVEAADGCRQDFAFWIDIDVYKRQIQDTIIATIEMNLKEADPDTLKNLGFDFSNTDMSFDKVVQDMKDQGFDCK